MRGPLVPVGVLPRFTSCVGPGTYETVPLDVQRYENGHFIFWRGPLVGGAALDPFRAWLEESHDAQVWTVAGTTPSQPFTTANTSGGIAVVITKRWFRVRVVLAADANGVVAISLWMAGTLDLRVD